MKRTAGCGEQGRDRQELRFGHTDLALVTPGKSTTARSLSPAPRPPSLASQTEPRRSCRRRPRPSRRKGAGGPHCQARADAGTHACTHRHTHRHTCSSQSLPQLTNLDANTYQHLQPHTPSHSHSDTHAYTSVHTRSFPSLFTHKRKHACVHTHTHLQTRALTHTITQSRGRQALTAASAVPGRPWTSRDGGPSGGSCGDPEGWL